MCLAMSKISIPVAKPWLGSEEVEAASKTILSGWVTQGPQVKAFENEFAAYTGAMCACAVSNCTTALHLALLAVGVKPGDEVITVSHSFIATANAVKYCGAEPVFIDIDPATYNMDPSLIAEAATERTSAILCVHQIGMPCDMDAILAVAAELRLPVVEDAACAIGSDIKVGGEWSKVGKAHGDVACFSFHPRKILTTGDGGMLTTNNASMDQQFRLLRKHGMSVPEAVRHDSHKIIFEEYVVLGFNYRMTDIQASIGRVQLGRLDDMITRRREQAAVYTAAIESVFGVSAPHEPEYARSN